MNGEKFRIIKDLFWQVLNAKTKKSAADHIRRLEFEFSLINDLEPHPKEKLSQAISFAKQACGQVRDKVHWTTQAEQTWLLFESRIGIL